MATPPTAYALARTSTFQELKAAANSDNIDDSMRFLFTQDLTENEGLVKVYGEKRDELVAKIKWFEDLVDQGERFLPLHENGDIGLEFMKQTLDRDRRMLVALTAVLDLVEEGRAEKKLQVFWFE